MEYKGKVQPTRFDRTVTLSREVEAQFYKDGQQDGDKIPFSPAEPIRLKNKFPFGNDFSAEEPRDEIASDSNDFIYDIDAVGIPTTFADPVGTVRRVRANFKEFAFVDNNLVFKLPGEAKARAHRYFQRCSGFFKYAVRVSAQLNIAQIKGTVRNATTKSLTTKASAFEDPNNKGTAFDLKGSVVTILSPKGNVVRGVAFVTSNTLDTITFATELEKAPDEDAVVIVTRPKSWVPLNDVAGDNTAFPGTTELSQDLK